MPVLGVRNSNKGFGKAYLQNPMAQYASSFKDVAWNMLQESSINLFENPNTALMRDDSLEALREFFVNESYDGEHMNAMEIEDHQQMMNELFENDRDGVLQEYANVGSFNPIIGMTFPLHKNLLMTNVFENNAIPKAVAASPKFTLSMETRMLVTPEGEEIDIWKEQDRIKAAMDSVNAYKEVVLTLPELGATDVLTAMGGTSKDNIDIDVIINKYTVKYRTALEPATYAEYTKVTRIKLDPGYGDYDRIATAAIEVPVSELPVGSVEVAPIKDTIVAIMKNNSFEITSLRGNVTKVTLKGRKDSSNGLINTCSTKWSNKTDIVEIPTAIPLNTTISPEEVKDVKALYNVDQLTKIMSIYKDVMGTYKDDTIRGFLDESMTRLPDSQKIDKKFDFVPRTDYALDHVTWRHATFFDALDTYVTMLLSVLNDPNMTITILGRPDIIRKILPTTYDYQSPQNIGAVELEYTRTVFTSNNRLYQFVSSQKLNKAQDANDLVIVLKPRGTERIIYRLYDYQFYVSNEIRNAANHALPAIHAFDRYLPVEYQPVQGRIEILHPSGQAYNQDTIYPGGVAIS